MKDTVIKRAKRIVKVRDGEEIVFRCELPKRESLVLQCGHPSQCMVLKDTDEPVCAWCAEKHMLELNIHILETEIAKCRQNAK